MLLVTEYALKPIDAKEIMNEDKTAIQTFWFNILNTLTRHFFKDT